MHMPFFIYAYFFNAANYICIIIMRNRWVFHKVQNCFYASVSCNSIYFFYELTVKDSVFF